MLFSFRGHKELSKVDKRRLTMLKTTDTVVINVIMFFYYC